MTCEDRLEGGGDMEGVGKGFQAEGTAGAKF